MRLRVLFLSLIALMLICGAATAAEPSAKRPFVAFIDLNEPIRRPAFGTDPKDSLPLSATIIDLVNRINKLIKELNDGKDVQWPEVAAVRSGAVRDYNDSIKVRSQREIELASDVIKRTYEIGDVLAAEQAHNVEVYNS
jgi:hypothetical protein